VGSDVGKSHRGGHWGRTRNLQVLARQIEEFRNFYSCHGLDEFNIRITTHKEVHTLHKVAQPKAIVNFHELIVFKDKFSDNACLERRIETRLKKMRK